MFACLRVHVHERARARVCRARVCVCVCVYVCAHGYACAYRKSGTLDRLCKLDMEQHCNWIAHGNDGLRDKGCPRMRPKFLQPVLGRASRVTGVMA